MGLGHPICHNCGGHYGEMLYSVFDGKKTILQAVCADCAKDFFESRSVEEKESERVEDISSRSDLYRLEVAKVLIKMANMRDSLYNVRRAEKVCLELYNSIMDDDSYLSEEM